MVVKKKWRTFHSFQEYELQLELGEIIAKNMAKTARSKTTRRATTAIKRIFAELEKPKRTLSKMNFTSTKVTMFLLCF